MASWPGGRGNGLLRLVVRAGKWLIETLTDDYLPGSNVLGVLVFLAVFGTLAVLGEEFIKTHGEGLLNLAGRALSIAIDLALRLLCGRKAPEYPYRGPRVVFLPLWVWGILWCISGVIQLLFGT